MCRLPQHRSFVGAGGHAGVAGKPFGRGEHGGSWECLRQRVCQENAWNAEEGVWTG